MVRFLLGVLTIGRLRSIPFSHDGGRDHIKINKIHVKSIEWAAGLFEGEGCMTTRSRLSLEMTDYDVVKDFADIVGVGNNITQRTRLGCKTSYQWSLSNKQDVRKLLSKFLPFFGSRRAFKALNILDDLELS